MNGALGIWLRRSPVTLAAPGLLVMVLLVAFSTNGWQYEWDWAVSWAAGVTVLLCPAVAGLVAHDRARRHRPTLTQAEHACVRGTRAAVSAPLAASIVATATWLFAVAVLGVRVQFSGAVGGPSPLPLLEVGVALLAAAFSGAAVGSVMTSPLTGLIVAGGLYLFIAFGPAVGLPNGFFQPAAAVGSLAGLRAEPHWATVS